MKPQLQSDNTLRKHGLFALVPVRRWHHDLWCRAAPVFAYLGLIAALGTSAVLILDNLDEATLSNQILAITIIFLAAVILVPPLLMFYGWRRIPPLKKRSLIWVAYFGYFAAIISLANQINSSITVFGAALAGAVSLGILVLFAEWCGLSVMIAWSMRASKHQLAVIGSAIGSIVPISLTMVVFSYFSPGVWQVVDQVIGRQMTAFAFFVFGLALIATITSARAEINTQMPATTKLIPRLNVYSVIIVTQLIQAFLFFAIMSILLLLLGLIIINDAAITAWIRHEPAHYWIGKYELPFGRIRFYAAYFISTFSTLSFLISTTTDASRRDRLFRPTISHVQKVLEKNV